MTLALVTGAARGIGAAIAHRLAATGHQLVLVDLNPAVRERAAALNAVAVEADIATEPGRAAIRDAVRATGEPLAVLVNNAGITRDALVADLTEDMFRQVTRINLGATYELTSTLAGDMADDGAVVNIGSRAHLGNVGQFNYAVSKAGIVGLTRTLALAYAPRLRVNAVAPGFVATDMTDAMPERVRDRIVSRIPLRRPGQPEDIASAVAWLASPEARYVTGQLLYSCGGRSYGSTEGTRT
ncbi:SDR family oxidoreductase [Nocardia ignorata]|uniref:3-oxoacyl-[acyl-carrier protein] reductase/2-hydroxycyclohexanecarboxyl-CoA dehydrogenase n=1 Tax=Nocardia ignorata TaxID=145285 RepID=A0A4R6PHM5_NOCIG|nr:SDR family oxidoreductase [Nocardia ignorata]TDP37808.1 3-oxoacyl-[acyl-carrier protein] reductase/2-hydroxycyclohexanecarboxyl-CoA dehydrogenase [Nocardia ignorata]